MSIGTRFNFSVGAGCVERFRLLLGEAGMNDVLNVATATFVFEYAVRGAQGTQVVLQHGAAAGELQLEVPALASGEYEYRVRYTSSLGEGGVLFFGTLTAMSQGEFARLEEAVEECYERTLQVSIGSDEAAAVELKWMASSVASQAAMNALENRRLAEAAAAEAAGNAAQVVQMLADAAAFMESFNEALRSCLEVDDNGYLWIGGYNTGEYLRGEDAPIPFISDELYWCLRDKDGAVTELGVKAVGENGLTPHIGPNDEWYIGSTATGVRAVGRDGLDGDALRRVMASSAAEVMAKPGERGVAYFVPNGSGYDVYQWLEAMDGTGAWTLIGDAVKIATAALHGIVMLSTSTEMSAANGGDIGKDASGRIYAKKSSVSGFGTGKLGSETVLESGKFGPVAMTASGAYGVPPASYGEYGALKLSYSGEVTGGGPVGFNSQGRAMVPWATKSSGGAIKLGSVVTERAPSTYLVGIGATEDHELAYNFLYGGALRHQKLGAWRGSQMEWVNTTISQFENDPNALWLDDDSYFTVIFTTRQFTQSNANGLELLSALETGDKVGGVFIATGMDDTREDAVVTALTLSEADAAVRDWADETFCKAENAVSLSDVRAELTGYATKEELTGYTTKEELTELEGKVLLKDETWAGNVVLTEAEYNALASSEILEDKIYFII